MPTKESTAPEFHAKDRVEFVDHHRVALEAGDYEVILQQEGTVVDEKGSHKIQCKEKRQPFSILGEQYALDPNSVHTVFPPAGSRGDFWHALPHMVLNRSTLPWERSGQEDTPDPAKTPPWLALLVFHEDEVPKVNVEQLVLGDLLKSGKTPVPGLNEEKEGQNLEDFVQVISVPKQVLERMLPGELDKPNRCAEVSQRYLTHARTRSAWMSDKKAYRVDRETAVVLANRLPMPNWAQRCAPGFHREPATGTKTFKIRL